ncbi:Hypothetical protein Minf_1057 [Methylacidiphilum infernorum V4]|uniref:Uncharacterized protein n=1 Tax=Methylacidiphilum infernorum (isolate V4) TaxID=481448 RepID=B3DUV9_METI4|nr:Hypothetical protein Minf_1057 [Methylacidiphilum infernorum V4]
MLCIFLQLKHLPKTKRSKVYIFKTREKINSPFSRFQRQDRNDCGPRF